ncbi:MAG TPA: AAA family ATPase, partial [Kofleriaceae bacterium]|nr:AAA family ATPase [Kofleriaceae bacterium]
MRQPIQPGSQRFEVRCQLGRGGMGTVYEAFDHERGIPVALKLLHDATPDALFRFKQEFRSLADVRHPNLVTLYELLAIDGEWLFTMELIEGVDLIDYLRPRDSASAPPEPELVSPSGDEDDTRSLAAGRRSRASDPAGGGQVDFVRVREVFLQLALGVQAIHDTGHVHRDIKPSNILITPAGRVVLLDFGVIGLQATDSETVARKQVVGTPRYMSPEQMQADAPPASVNDWYAFGLVLYEALTGRRAFSGTFDAMRAAKLAGAFIPPDELDAEIPADLVRLCTSLLRPDPAARSTPAQVFESLGEREALVGGGPGADAPMLVGRAAELALLADAFERVRAEEGGVVRIAGGSGIGKSSLVRVFLDRLVERDDVVVLAGRCHEHEEVPYKGVDRLVDELSRLLAMLPPNDVTPLVPKDAQSLARVFPVLRRVEAIAALPPWLGNLPEPIELRRRAFDEMRELLSRLARRAPLVLVIDDFQWADPDSAALLAELMSPPRVPPLLLIISARSEDPTMVDMLAAKLPASPPPWFASIDLVPLTRDAARSLLDAANIDADAADQLVVESGGNPYFLQELMRGANARRSEFGSLTLDQMLLERVTALPAGARVLIELVSVAGKPTLSAVIRTALDEVAGEPLGAALWPMRRQQLLRSRDVDGEDLLEPYHDRVREAVVAAMDGERRRALHRALASAMQGLESPDIEALATHLEGAGEAFAAARGYARAADAAAEILAFDRAAALYQRSLQLAPVEGV